MDVNVSDPISAGIGLLTDIIDKIFPNQADRDKAKLALLEQAQAGDLAQLKVNAAEGANPNWFVAGWRPFIGWVCGSAFAWTFVFQPLIAVVLSASGHPAVLPTLDLSTMMPVLLGMLGLGGMRTFEKFTEAQKNH